MSTLRGDLERNSPIDLDPLVGLHRPSPDSPLTFGEQLSDMEQTSARTHEESGEEKRWKEDLCHAISCNKWSDAKAILDQNPNALTAQIAVQGRTALHVAAMFGHVTVVEELLKLLAPEFLLTGDSDGRTALAMACWYSGNIQVAKCLVNKNSDILGIPNVLGNIPVIVSFRNGYPEMGRYLYSVTPLECLTGHKGSILLRVCFHAQCFDIALHLLQQCEELLLVPFNEKGRTPIHEIATLKAAIFSPSELIFWKRWIYNYVDIPSTTAIDHVCVSVQQEDRSQGDKAKLIEPGNCTQEQVELSSLINRHGLPLRLITSTINFVGMDGVKKIQELKLLHAQANDLLRLVCKNAKKANQRVIDEAICLAAKEGNVEFVFQVSKVIPEIFLTQTLVRCFNEALDYRQARVFNLIHGLRFKNALVTVRSDNGNTLMHKAAIKAPDHILNRIYAPTLQMQRELQWFKEVESLTPPSVKGFRNMDDMTAEELFRETHRELIKQGEKWLKSTASSCSVVGALIMTIMFAVAFTVPGGNDQILGYPLFIEQPLFKVFIFSTITSLLSSSTSVLMFLAILTSQYSEKKFLKSLPTKLILGISFLFISIVSMIIAFLSTIHLMLKHTNYLSGLLPIIVFASVPVFLFVLSQFPLLLHTYVYTYGNIFDRKVKLWL